MNRVFKTLLIFGLLTVFLYSGLQAWNLLQAYTVAEVRYTELEEYISLPVEMPTESQERGETPVLLPAETETIVWPQVDFDALAAINPDIVGWVTIEGTGIHYPVVQGEDNDFYLSHQFDKSTNRVGCLFLDARNKADFSDRNQIVYGHYVKNKSMFYDLGGYKRQEFFDAHPTGWLITPSAVYRLDFFAGYVSDVFGDAWNTAFSEEDYLAWLKNCQAQSCFSSEIVPSADSRILTLSTCSYEFHNARFVLHAVLERQAIHGKNSDGDALTQLG